MGRDVVSAELARIREKALHDEATALKSAKAEGRAEERADMFKKLKEQFGFTDEQLAALSST